MLFGAVRTIRPDLFRKKFLYHQIKVEAFEKFRKIGKVMELAAVQEDAGSEPAGE